MHNDLHTVHDSVYFRPFIDRRKRLIQRVMQTTNKKHGLLVLMAGADTDERYAFRQDSTFYYFTGITQPGLIAIIDLQGKSILFIPQYTVRRDVWIYDTIVLMQEHAEVIGFDHITWLGHACPGYSIDAMMLYERPSMYEYVGQIINSAKGQPVFMVKPTNVYQKAVTTLIESYIHTDSPIVDITADVAAMRRTKEPREIDAHKHAIAITAQAQKMVAQTIKPGKTEAEIKAILEGVMIKADTQPAFASIVASGPHATILHYTRAHRTMVSGDLVVVDIGAEYNYYAADITRTYPTSGTFSQEQRGFYQLVLDVQEYIASQAKPGYWLKNPEYPDTSLHHMAVEFFKQKGVNQYFMHGIGHYLGLDVHDVGSYQEPLAPGDLFTIEPGLYIRDKAIGIRIEDNYLVTSNGVECLSAAIPKTIEDIEHAMAHRASLSI
ncbi:MAG TPA: Xaa-Pro aminopeptidase [Candidatus Babeliales bacterium]|jgi:Xaa-Pro aminopeptidase|nr:Xaa-Pro aminopeptidase [Candidatus Babeliales bacterium]